MKEIEHIKLGSLVDTRSPFEKNGELHHTHLTGVTAPYQFKTIPQTQWKHYTQRNQDGNSGCTSYSSSTIYEANTGLVVSARPPYANRPNKPQEGAIPAVMADLWIHPGTTSESLCPSDNLTESQINVPFTGTLPYEIQNKIIINVKDINELAESIDTYKAIAIDIAISWPEWTNSKGSPKYIPGSIVVGGHQMAGIQPMIYNGKSGIMCQQSWGKDAYSINNNGWVFFDQDFLFYRGTGALAYIFRPSIPTNPIVTLTRDSDNGVETLGRLSYGSFSCDTLERPWKNNQVNISCIPKGSYNVVWSFSSNPSLGWTYEVQKVPGRSGIRIHQGNFVSNSEGCILLGNGRKDINNDNQPDVLSSVATLSKFNTLMNKQSFTLIVK